MNIENDVTNIFAAKPDHSHYDICSDRMACIRGNSKRCFFFDCFAITCFFIFLIFSHSNPIPIPFFLLFTIMGCTKYKIGHFIMLIVYAAIIVIFLIEFIFEFTDYALFLTALGGFGVYTHKDSYADWRNYIVLRQTEGFPYFNKRFIDQLDNPDYKTEYYREDYADEELPMNEVDYSAVDTFNIPEFKPYIVLNDMEDIPDKPVEIPTRGCGKRAREKAKSVITIPDPNTSENIDLKAENRKIEMSSSKSCNNDVIIISEKPDKADSENKI